MESASVPQTEKREFKNQTIGWLGVVVIDARGEEKGVSVEPEGTVWLSEAEVILTARAPRRPEDNPFEEQTFIGIDANGQRAEFKMRPLVPADTDPRYVPSQDRYVPPSPSTEAEAAVHAEAAARDFVVTSPQAAAREAAVVAAPPLQGSLAGVTPVQDPVPAATAPQPPSTGSQTLAEEDTDPREPLYREPPAPGEILAGSLPGSNEPSPQVSQSQAGDQTAAPAGAAPPPQPPAPPAPPVAPPMTAEELAGAPPVEEHAEAVDPRIGEETGQAKPPVGDAAQGEFAQSEEVGSPDAPARASDPSTDGGLEAG